VVVKVSNVNAEAKGDWIVVSFQFTASRGGWIGERAKGKLYALGRPTYDLNSQTISVSQLDYDVNTKNVVLNVAKWLLKPEILQAASKAATVKVAPLLADAKTKANQYCATLQAPPGIKPTLTIDAINLDDVRLNGGDFFLLVKANGTSSLQLGN
jgi:hypothetical protein